MFKRGTQSFDLGLFVPRPRFWASPTCPTLHLLLSAPFLRVLCVAGAALAFFACLVSEAEIRGWGGGSGEVVVASPRFPRRAGTTLVSAPDPVPCIRSWARRRVEIPGREGGSEGGWWEEGRSAGCSNSNNKSIRERNGTKRALSTFRLLCASACRAFFYCHSIFSISSATRMSSYSAWFQPCDPSVAFDRLSVSAASRATSSSSLLGCAL